MPRAMTRFRGAYAFLSNFYPSPIPVGDLVAPTAEHAFQLLKTNNLEERRWICDAATPAMAKRRGRTVTIRADWFQCRLEAMGMVLRMKFAPGTELAAQLIATGDADLVEGNTWGDQFWGVSRGRGQNHLGRLLMKIRAELLGVEGRTRDEAESGRSPRGSRATAPN